MVKLLFISSMVVAVLAAAYGFTGEERLATAVAVVAFAFGVLFGLVFFFRGVKRRSERKPGP